MAVDRKAIDVKVLPALGTTSLRLKSLLSRVFIASELRLYQQLSTGKRPAKVI
jgi:hypothetical protein